MKIRGWAIAAILFISNCTVPVAAQDGNTVLGVLTKFEEFVISNSNISDQDLLRMKQELSEQKLEQQAKVFEQLQEVGSPAESIRLGCYNDIDCTLTDLAIELLDQETYRNHFGEAFLRMRSPIHFLRKGTETSINFRPLGNLDDIRPAAMFDIMLRTSLLDQPEGLEKLDAAVLSAQIRLLIVLHDLHSAALVNKLSNEDIKAALAIREVASFLNLLAIHADRTPLVQQRVLSIMKIELEQNTKLARSYAVLYDRVAISLGNQQEYGSQITCSNGEPIAENLANEGTVNQRRADVGLGSLQDYLKIFLRQCEAEN